MNINESTYKQDAKTKLQGLFSKDFTNISLNKVTGYGHLATAILKDAKEV